MKIKEYIVESFKTGYCKRFYIQAGNIKEAKKIAFDDYNININKEEGYFCFN